MRRRGFVPLMFAGFLMIGPFTGKLLADGDATLGDPSIAIAAGTSLISGGTGMVTQPATIDLDVPAGASVVQVLLYWVGRPGPSDTLDDTIEITGVGEVMGTLIGAEDDTLPLGDLMGIRNAKKREPSWKTWAGSFWRL